MAVSRRLRYEILRRDGHACRYCGSMAPDVKITVDHVIPSALGGSDDPANLVAACADCNAGKSSVPADAALVEDVGADALRWKRALEAAASNLTADRELMQGYADRFHEKWSKWTRPVKITVPAEPIPQTGDPLIDGWRSIVGYYTGEQARPVECIDGTLRVQIQDGHRKDVKYDLGLVGTRRKLSQAIGQDVTAIEVVPGWDGALPRQLSATTEFEDRPYALPTGWQDSIARFISNGLPEQEMHRLIRVAMAADYVDDRFRFFCGCCWRVITDLQEDARRILESESA